MDPELATDKLGQTGLAVAHPSSSQKHQPPKFRVYPGLPYIRLDSETPLLSRLRNKQLFSSPKTRTARVTSEKACSKFLARQHSIQYCSIATTAWIEQLRSPSVRPTTELPQPSSGKELKGSGRLALHPCTTAGTIQPSYIT